MQYFYGPIEFHFKNIWKNVLLDSEKSKESPGFFHSGCTITVFLLSKNNFKDRRSRVEFGVPKNYFLIVNSSYTVLKNFIFQALSLNKSQKLSTVKF